MPSLFDRILNPLASELASPKDRLNQELLSVEGELNRLLNTRAYLAGLGLPKTRSILDYGLDNIVSSGCRGTGRLNEVIENVRAAIRAYEPRIVGPAVEGEYDAKNPGKVMLTVVGKLRQSQAPIKFRIPITLPSNESR